MTEKKHCPLCGENAYYHQTKPFTLHYKKHVITVQQPGYWCDACKEGVIGDEDRKATQKELQAFRAKVDGLLTPDAIKSIHTKLHIKQDEAGELFGGGVNAFSRYERGLTPIPRSTSHLLRILDKHPNLLRELNN